jgi:hypothetical protein
MLESHPCGAWFLLSSTLLLAAHSLWSLIRLSRWIKSIILSVLGAVFVFYARQEVRAHTELDFLFVEPGIFIVEEHGDWMLLVSGRNTRVPLSNVQIVIQDVVTTNAIRNEPDPDKRAAMVRGGIIERNFPEVGPTFMGGEIGWRPIDVNNQEYNIQARYRIGDKPLLDVEEIRIVNVGERFVTAQEMHHAPIWQFSVTVKNQSGQTLMHCVDPKFPRDARWTPGVTCFPGPNYGPLPRSICKRCLGWGFEFRK